MSETNNTKTNQTSPMETLRAASRKQCNENLKEIVHLTTKRLNAGEYVGEGHRDLRSVRAAAIDVIVERLGEDAGDQLMDDNELVVFKTVEKMGWGFDA